MPSVAEVAKAAGVSTAAVRARLAEGSLEGRQESRGNRSVWVIEDAAAAAYISAHRGPGEPGRAGPSVAEVAATPAAARPQPQGAPAELRAASPASWLAQDPASLELGAVLAENERLRAALGALSRAHQALVELVGVAFVDSPAARGHR